MTGAAKVIAMNSKDNDAGFLDGTDASDAFATQLNKSYDLIYELSFTVKPPELKSGDLPGVAIKLLYSPALEVAMNDSQKLQPFLDKLVEIAKFGMDTKIMRRLLLLVSISTHGLSLIRIRTRRNFLQILQLPFRMDSSRSRLHRSVVLTSQRMPSGSVSYVRRKRRTSKTFLWIFSVRITKQRMLSRKRRLQRESINSRVVTT